jgi:septal ring-binding cell division protein DamX
MNVMYGTFATYQEAKNALAALPSAYQSQRPLLRTLKGIKNEIQLREGV